jgi:hypothetical protein
MNLVSVLLVPLVVEHSDDISLRIAVGAVAAVILAVAIWISKSRRSELEEEIKRADAMAGASV